MSYEPKDNSGALFKVDELKSESHPPYEGDFKIACPHCNGTLRGWVKAWVKEGRKGKFFSLAFKHKTGSAPAERRPERKASSGDAPW